MQVSNFLDWVKKKFLALSVNIDLFLNVENFMVTAFSLYFGLTSEGIGIIFPEMRDKFFSIF
jgi:hypothetical protein